MICGIDEAGRGPLAGPVCAASVILSPDFPIEILDDSKKLRPALREKIRGLIFSQALAWGIGWASASEIDAINIHAASLLAMKRAFDAMLIDFGAVIREARGSGLLDVVVDGLFTPDLSVPCRALVKADSIVPEVMAASVLAKTSRDRLMEFYSIFCPGYGYEKHKGYPTSAHREAIVRLGPSPIQRMSFRVKEKVR